MFLSFDSCYIWYHLFGEALESERERERHASVPLPHPPLDRRCMACVESTSNVRFHLPEISRKKLESFLWK